MAGLLPFHLFQAKQWKEAETSFLLWDQTLSKKAAALCSPESTCLPIVKFLTETVSLQIAFALVLAALTWKATRHLKKNEQIKLILSLALFFGLGDFLSNQLKYLFQRLRPDHAPMLVDGEWVHSFSPSFSLPSNHAFNLFAIAMLYFLLQKKNYLKGVNFPIALFSLATLVALSRVFAWRHYPLDIIAGLIFGCLYACSFMPLLSKFVHAPSQTVKL